MRLRPRTLFLSALLPALTLLRAVARLLTRGGHASSLVTRAWAWSFRLPIPHGFRRRTLRLLNPVATERRETLFT